MSKNLNKKGLAIGSIVALASAGLFAMPASALTGEVELAPAYGNNYSVFLDDDFYIDADIRSGNDYFETEPAFGTAYHYDSNSPGAGSGTWDDSARVVYNQLKSNVTLEVTGIGGEKIQLEINHSSDDSIGLVAAAQSSNAAYSDDTALGPISVQRGLNYYVGGSDELVLVSYYNAAGTFIDDTTIGSWDDELGSFSFDTSSSDDSDIIDRIVVSNIPDFDRNVEYRLAQSDNVFGDGNVSVQTRVWIENSGSIRTVESAYASASETVTFFDPAGVIVTPRIERFNSDDVGVVLNSYESDLGTDELGFTIQFSKAVNLEQIDVRDWYAELFENNVSIDDEYLEDSNTDSEALYGYADLSDDLTKAYFTWNESISAGDTYRITVTYDGEMASGDTPRVFTSSAYRAPSSDTDAADLSWSSADSANVLAADDTSFDQIVRSGTKSVTWSVQLIDSSGDALADANVPVVAAIYTDNESSSFLEEGETLTANGQVMEAGNDVEGRVVSGFTNAKGQFDLTVTHSNPEDGDGYFIELAFLDNSDYFENSNNYGYDLNVTYEDAFVSEISVDNEVIASTPVVVEYEVSDQFGEPISSFDGDALSVQLLSTNDEDIEEYAAVKANGTVSFSFDNYLESPDTDVLTATVGVGLSSASFEVAEVASVSSSLYAPVVVSAISVDEEIATFVSYEDFVVGDEDFPTDNSVTLGGTIAGADNGGLPGAPVTISGAGLQFGTTDGDYTIGSVTVIADVDGQFEVEVFTHDVNATGQTISVVSGGITETLLLISSLPDDLEGANLAFSWNLPEYFVKNTTYSVELTLTDKWGNPVNTTGSSTRAVAVSAAGSIEVNGVDQVSKNFGSDGASTVFLRSVADVAGPGSVTAMLDDSATYGSVDLDGDSATFDLGDLGAISTDATATVWDETTWSAELEETIEVLDVAPASASKVNAGSFNGYVAVYAKGLKGQTLSWKIAGVWFKTTITEDYQVFQRKTIDVGATVLVDIYVNGVRPAALSKSVVTR